MIVFNAKVCDKCGHVFKARTGKRVRNIIGPSMYGDIVDYYWYCKGCSPEYDEVVRGLELKNGVPLQQLRAVPGLGVRQWH